MAMGVSDANITPAEMLGPAPAPRVVPRASRAQSCLLAVLLVAASADEGSPQIVFRWPRRPAVRKRHSRVKYYTQNEHSPHRHHHHHHHLAQESDRQAAPPPDDHSPLHPAGPATAVGLSSAAAVAAASSGIVSPTTGAAAPVPSGHATTRGRAPILSTVRDRADAVRGRYEDPVTTGATLASLGVDANQAHTSSALGEVPEQGALPTATTRGIGNGYPDPVRMSHHSRRPRTPSDVFSEDHEEYSGYSTSSSFDSRSSSRTQSTDSDVPMDAAAPQDRRGSEQSGSVSNQGARMTGSWSNASPSLDPRPDSRAGASGYDEAAVTKAYNRYLGFDTTYLATMLNPRELSDRKFELIVDDLAFVGHPVTLSPPAAASRSVSRSSADLLSADFASPLAVDPDLDASDASGRRSPSSHSLASSRSRSRSAHGRTPESSPGGNLQFFHFVLVLDRPDPSWDMPFMDANLAMHFFYSNVVFKMAAALYAEQERANFVGIEAHRLTALKEKCIRLGYSVKQFQSQALSTSSLARCMRSVFTKISAGEDVVAVVNDRIEAHLQLPPILRLGPVLHKVQDVVTDLDPNDPEWLKGSGFAGLGDGRDTFEAMMQLRPEDLMYEEWTRTIGPYLLPWKTLLMMDDSAFNMPDTPFPGAEWAGADDSAPPRSDAWTRGLASTSLSMARPRPSSPDASGNQPWAEAVGMEPWAEQFIRLLRPTPEGIPTFAELQDLLGWNQCEDIYPMVRHLIYYREAKVVDVPRIKNIYMVSPLLDPADLPTYAAAWARDMPQFSPLPAFLADLSSSTQAFSKHPDFMLRGKGHAVAKSLHAVHGGNLGAIVKALALRALIWLLRADIIVQLHVRLRIQVRPEIKAAWRAGKEQASRARHEARARAQPSTTSDHRSSPGVPLVGPKRVPFERKLSSSLTHLPSSRAPTSSSFAGPQSTTLGALGRGHPHPTPALPELTFDRIPVKPVEGTGPSGVSLMQRGRLPNRSTNPPPTQLQGQPPSATAEGRRSALTSPEARHPHLSGSLGTVQSEPVTARVLPNNQVRSISRPRKVIRGFGGDQQVAIHQDEREAEGAFRSNTFTLSNLPPVHDPPLARGGHDSGHPAAHPSGRPAMPSQARSPHLGSERDQMGANPMSAATGLSSLLVHPPWGADEASVATESPLVGDDVQLLEAEELFGDSDWLSIPIEEATIIKEPTQMTWFEGEWVDLIIERAVQGLEGREDEHAHPPPDAPDAPQGDAPSRGFTPAPPRGTGRASAAAALLRRILPYLNGKHSVDEIALREDLRRREIRLVRETFKEDLIEFLHP